MKDRFMIAKIRSWEVMAKTWMCIKGILSRILIMIVDTKTQMEKIVWDFNTDTYTSIWVIIVENLNKMEECTDINILLVIL